MSLMHLQPSEFTSSPPNITPSMGMSHDTDKRTDRNAPLEKLKEECMFDIEEREGSFRWEGLLYFVWVMS